MKRIDIERIINNASQSSFEGMKISYMILKPNAAKHYGVIINEIINNRFTILGQYAVLDYETVNMALHIDQPTAMKYIIPISRMYNDFYGNYGVLIVLGKRNITYENFCLQVVTLKKGLRAKFELSYISYAFDTSELGAGNEKQRLVIISPEGKEIKKDKFNEEGTYMVFFINEIHSPDETVDNTVKELKFLMDMGLLEESNTIPSNLLDNMRRYHTFEFLKDMP